MTAKSFAHHLVLLLRLLLLLYFLRHFEVFTFFHLFGDFDLWRRLRLSSSCNSLRSGICLLRAPGHAHRRGLYYLGNNLLSDNFGHFFFLSDNFFYNGFLFKCFLHFYSLFGHLSLRSDYFRLRCHRSTISCHPG